MFTRWLKIDVGNRLEINWINAASSLLSLSVAIKKWTSISLSSFFLVIVNESIEV